MNPLPRKPGAVGVILLLITAGAALLLLRSDAEVDHDPVVQTSALRAWTAPWAAGEAAADAAPRETAPLEETQNPGSPPATCDSMPERWLVIGWDGADWDLVLPLLEAGKLPHLESLMRRGSYGTLHSIVPTLSPAIWTTVATGVAPDRHGILHFYNQKPLLGRLIERVKNLGTLQRELYSNADRLEPTIWNELSARGREVMLVGYHNTFPVEKVNGVMVSNYLMQDSVADVMDMEVDGGSSSSLGGSLVYPPERLQEVLDIQRRVKQRTPDIIDRFARLEEAERMPFLRLSQRLDAEDQKPYYLVHAWLFDTIAAETAESLLARSQPDLAMVHFQAVDWAAHRFYYFHDPELFAAMDWPPEVRRSLEAEISRYAGTLEAFYIYLDEWLGRLLALRAPGTAVMLLSDHGFEPDADPQIPGGHDDAPPGVLVLEGPGIEAGRKLAPADVYDILPTLMAGLQEAVAEDLPGQPIREAFCPGAWQIAEHSTVASYTSGGFVPEIVRSDSLDQEVLEQLESLGYLD